jgi:hypothetical protein
VYKSEDAGDTWEHILETEGAGMNIAIHPDNNNLLFVADNNGGVWVSIDQGDTWRQENDGLGSLSVSGVKVQNNYVYVVTEGFGVYAGTVAMRSAVNRFTGNVIEKGSIIWDDSRSNNLVNEVYNIQLMVDPTDSSRIFASSYPGGMMRSDDQGETWHSKNFLLPSFRLNDPDTKGYYAFAMNPNDPENIVTCLFGKGCYMSYDGLDFNIPFSVGLENKDVYNVVFDSSGEYVYAGTNGGSAFRAKVELEEETRSNSVPTGLRRFAPSLTWWDSIKNLFW